MNYFDSEMEINDLFGDEKSNLKSSDLEPEKISRVWGAPPPPTPTTGSDVWGLSVWGIE